MGSFSLRLAFHRELCRPLANPPWNSEVLEVGVLEQLLGTKAHWDAKTREEAQWEGEAPMTPVILYKRERAEVTISRSVWEL